MAIQPINIVAAALVTQILIIITWSVGTWLLGGKSYRRLIRLNIKDDPLKIHVMRFSTIIILATILTLAILVSSDEFVSAWKPLLGNLTFSTGLDSHRAISIVFFIDIFVVAYFVWKTEGTRKSPFSPLFFFLPTLAIFLRQPLFQVFMYMSLVFVFFTVLMFCRRLSDSQELDESIAWSFWAVSLLCFVVTSFLAVITRPL
jgi:hypothetical protein